MSALASEVSPEVTDALFGVNTLGPIKLTRAALPYMLARRKGRIVVVASMAAKVPSPGQTIYSGSIPVENIQQNTRGKPSPAQLHYVLSLDSKCPVQRTVLRCSFTVLYNTSTQCLS
jgi:NADP-dependent 3-hydroxy acid dehydrogenase YdfG